MEQEVFVPFISVLACPLAQAHIHAHTFALAVLLPPPLRLPFPLSRSLLLSPPAILSPFPLSRFLNLCFVRDEFMESTKLHSGFEPTGGRRKLARPDRPDGRRRARRGRTRRIGGFPVIRRRRPCRGQRNGGVQLRRGVGSAGSRERRRRGDGRRGQRAPAGCAPASRGRRSGRSCST